jgi:hypothetical protein
MVCYGDAVIPAYWSNGDFFRMPTGIWIAYTRDGFVVAADGRKGVGETESTRTLTNNQQKIFKVENPGRSLAYAMAGAVGLSNRGSDDIVVDLVSEIGKTATSLAEQRFVEPSFYVRKLCRPAYDLLVLVKQSGQLLEYPNLASEPTVNQPGKTIALLFIAGFYEGLPMSFMTRFFHSDQQLGELAPQSIPLSAGQDFGYGSKQVWDAMNQNDRQFRKYVVRRTLPLESTTIPQAVEIARKRILACCDPVARQLDPVVCNSIGGHIHIASITRQSGFRWEVPPIAGSPVTAA